VLGLLADAVEQSIRYTGDTRQNKSMGPQRGSCYDTVLEHRSSAVSLSIVGCCGGCAHWGTHCHNAAEHGVMVLHLQISPLVGPVGAAAGVSARPYLQ
jgi:hypothetical protein